MPKNALFLLKNRKNRRALGARHQTPLLPAAEGFASRPPLASSGWGLRLQTPATALPMTNSWLRACRYV